MEMSMSLILVPIAVAIFVTSAEAVDAMQMKKQCSSEEIIEGIKTKYVSCNLLTKTLVEHGISVIKESETMVIAKFPEGTLTYYRENVLEPFKMNVSNIKNAEAVLCNVELIEEEYNANVQTYEYERIMQNLPSNMTIENEEVLEDDSILITLNID